MNLPEGAALEVSYRDGQIIIEPAPRSVRIVRKGALRVAVAVEPSDPLSNDGVREAREALRRRGRD